jgi:putative phosphoesterase
MAVEATESLRKVAVIGDIHGQASQLRACLKAIRARERIDRILAVGDIVNLDAETEECCKLLMRANVVAVRGNHDRWFFELAPYRLTEDTRPSRVSNESAEFLASLPVTRHYETVAGPLLLCHGLGNDDMAGVYPGNVGPALERNIRLYALVAEKRYRFVINGHTHQRMVRSFDGLTIINAGTICKDENPGFCIVDFETATAQYYNIDPKGNVEESDRRSLNEET